MHLLRRCATMTFLLAVACQAPAEVPYREHALLPGRTPFEQLQFVSQLDRLPDTTADYARCSAAATLSAYLLLGGDFGDVARRFDIPAELTYANVHRVQEALYHLANKDGRPGILGASIAQRDLHGRLVGWRPHPGDEYHVILEALGLQMDRVYAETRDDLHDKRAAVERWVTGDRPVVFVVGVDEIGKEERFVPMHERGNHYVIIFWHEGAFYALDSFRKPGNSALVELSDEEVGDNLFYTPNALFVVWR